MVANVGAWAYRARASGHRGVRTVVEMSVARRGRAQITHHRYSDASSDSNARSDTEGQDVESDEYGSVEQSGSDVSDRESGDGHEDERKVDEINTQQAKPQVVDHDEDRRNPQYIPKRGTFYEHDDRTAAGLEDGSVAEISDGIATIELSRIDRNNANDVSEKNSVSNLTTERRKTPKSSADRWLHDKYNENDQAPKSSEELMAVYGYDIRGEEGPPKALRRHRYGRGPNKYTRNWEDETAYGKGINTSRIPKQPPSVTNGKEFPSLQIKNERNRIEKRRKIEKKVRVVDNKVSSDKNSNDKVAHDKVFINKTNKIEKDVQEKRHVSEDSQRWKNRTIPKTEVRKPAIIVKTQVSQPEQTKWPETSRVSSPPKPLPLLSSQVQTTPPPAVVPLQENKLPSARKTTPVPFQNQVPPRMQAAATAALLPTATTVTPSTAPTTDAATRGKRYSNIRQRPMPDTYQSHQQQYITEFSQPLQKQSSSQQSVSNIATSPHQQTPPLIQSNSQHHPQIPQIHQQTPPPSLHQSSSQLHQQTTQIHPPNTQIHQQSGQIHQQTPQIATQIHQPTQQIHQQTPQIHPANNQMSNQIHQSNTQLIQQNPQIHQQSSQLHPQSPSIHQQTPPPTLQQPQSLHPTPPPTHQTMSRQQANLPLRQVPRTHQQQMTIHSMSMQQGGLVASQNYATPQIIAQNQYIQSPNGTVYGHVVSQVYPPPQAYATPQHQPIPPQALPPQALPPQPMPPQSMPPQPMPPQALPPPALPPHSYHHQAPATPHQPPYPSHTARSVFREPSGITYYSPQEQKGTAPPTRRPTNAIPIVPPPPKERGKLADNVPPPTDNIDHIVDNMFVPRTGRTGPSRPGEALLRSSESPITKQCDDIRYSEEKMLEDRKSKENTPEIITSRVELTLAAGDIHTFPPIMSNVEMKTQIDTIPKTETPLKLSEKMSEAFSMLEKQGGTEDMKLSPLTILEEKLMLSQKNDHILIDHNSSLEQKNVSQNPDGLEDKDFEVTTVEPITLSSDISDAYMLTTASNNANVGNIPDKVSTEDVYEEVKITSNDNNITDQHSTDTITDPSN